MNIKLRLSFIVTLLLLLGCNTIPPDALLLTHESLQQRQLQTKRFDTTDEEKMLSSCAGLLQDLGFTIQESETDLGVLLGTKNRSAVNAGQRVAAVAIALLGGGIMATDKEQLMRASVVTHPIGNPVRGIAVRVTFQRVVWNTNNDITKQELIMDENIYAEFFQKLSKSVFLEANEL
ncbi:MAG: hypothetical protein NTW14_03990 [bacterium]|nr:hypothetical protein [bacterium]